MTDPTTISNIGVAMFTIADQDAAIAFYTQTLGWELRADVAFGDEGGNRWVEVAPPGSETRLARNPPMGGPPGGGGVAVERPDRLVRHADLGARRGGHGIAHGSQAAGVEPGRRVLIFDELGRPH